MNFERNRRFLFFHGPSPRYGLSFLEIYTNFRLLELEADEDAPRHISLNNEDSKNIPLSVAEAQVAKKYHFMLKVGLGTHMLRFWRR